jgi:hypothetical protein
MRGSIKSSNAAQPSKTRNVESQTYDARMQQFRIFSDDGRHSFSLQLPDTPLKMLLAPTSIDSFCRQ